MINGRILLKCDSERLRIRKNLRNRMYYALNSGVKADWQKKYREHNPAYQRDWMRRKRLNAV